MAYVVTIKKIEVFEVSFPDGSKIEMRQEGTDWNDIRELRTENGHTLIAMRKGARNVLGEFWPGLFRMDNEEWILLRGSPALLERLQTKKEGV